MAMRLRPLQVGKYQYRLSAWNAYAWSPYAVIQDCVTDNSSLPCSACERQGTCREAGASLAHDEASGTAAERQHAALVKKLGSAIVGGLIIAAVFMVLPRLC